MVNAMQLTRTEEGLNWTAHAPGNRYISASFQEYGGLFYLDLVQEWESFADYSAYVAWRLCMGGIGLATTWPYNGCEPTCDGGMGLDGIPRCNATNTALHNSAGSLVQELLGYGTPDSVGTAIAIANSIVFMGILTDQSDTTTTTLH